MTKPTPSKLKVLLFKHTHENTYELLEGDARTMKQAESEAKKLMESEFAKRVPFFSKKWFLVAEKDGVWIDQ